MIDIRLSDNLELMAEMQDNTVDLIYCDILYGTGRKFKDYQDLKPKREIIEEHYIPRIKEMHRILKDTGSIYLQMDTKINHWLRCVLDDVFGYENFRNEIIWTYETAGRRSLKRFKPSHDVILFYGKQKHKLINCLHLEEIKNKYTGYYEDKKGWYQMTGVGDYSKESIFKLKSKGLIHTNSKGKNYLKVYLFEDNGVLYKEKQFTDVFKNIDTFGGVRKDLKIENTGYNTQKPKELIERIIKASSNEGDLVADFYAGSFTTAEVCKDLNRNFIGCDISKKAVAIGLERTKY
tara:strand:- start:40 stop:915 length:876 start_codon:yes stop_codon:yes gene_type:complete